MLSETEDPQMKNSDQHLMRRARALSALVVALLSLLLMSYIWPHVTNLIIYGQWDEPNNPNISVNPTTPDLSSAPAVLGFRSELCPDFVNGLRRVTPTPKNSTNTRYKVSCQDGEISHIERFWPVGVSLDEARKEVPNLLPPDAELKKSYITKAGQQADLYHSYILSLRATYDTQLPTTTASDNTDNRSVDMLVIYHMNQDHVSSIQISTVDKQ